MRLGAIRTIAARAMVYAMVASGVSACAASHARAPMLEIGSGEASYYADRFTGKRTASGEAYDPEEFTAAHRTLPFGTLVRVTDVASGRSVVVKVNDRGPWGRGMIDISRAAAKELGLIRRGRGQVTLHYADREDRDDYEDGGD